MNHYLDLSVLDRSKALRIWMLYHKITASSLAKELEVDPSLICRILNCQKSSQRVLDKLIELGAPQALLPVKKTKADSKREQSKRRRGRPSAES